MACTEGRGRGSVLPPCPQCKVYTSTLCLMDPSYSTLRGSGATVRPRMVHTVHGMHAPAIGDDVQWRNTSRGQTGLLYTHHSSGAAVGSVGAYTVGQRCFAPVWDCERACLKEAGGGFPTGYGVVCCCCSAELAGVQRTTFARNGSCGGSAALSAALSN